MTTSPWKIVTPEQLKKGWYERRGETPVHHQYLILGRTDQGNYIVRNPELFLLEHPIETGVPPKDRTV